MIKRISNYNIPTDNKYIILGTILANFIVYLIIYLNLFKLQKSGIWFSNLKVSAMVINTYLIISTISMARYLCFKLDQSNINFINFILLVLILQLIKTVIMIKIFNHINKNYLMNNDLNNKLNKYSPLSKSDNNDLVNIAKLITSNTDKINYKLFIADTTLIALSIFIGSFMKKHTPIN
jgi:hypothetical protein